MSPGRCICRRGWRSVHGLGVGVQRLLEIRLEPEAGSPIGHPTEPIRYVGRTVLLRARRVGASDRLLERHHRLVAQRAQQRQLAIAQGKTRVEAVGIDQRQRCAVQHHRQQQE